MGNRLMSEEQIMALVNQVKTDTEKAWLAAYRDFCKHSIIHLDREIIVTPFEGHYGFAGVVITINGSPVRGMMLVKSCDIVEQVPTVHGGIPGRIQAMYVLDGDGGPRQLKDPFFGGPKKHAALWMITKALLIERGLLPENK